MLYAEKKPSMCLGSVLKVYMGSGCGGVCKPNLVKRFAPRL